MAPRPGTSTTLAHAMRIGLLVSENRRFRKPKVPETSEQNIANYSHKPEKHEMGGTTRNEAEPLPVARFLRRTGVSP